MKKLFIILTYIITFLFTSGIGYGAENQLHSITLEKNDSAFNIILGSDKLAKVTKKSSQANELVIELTGVTSSDTVNAIYKGTQNVDGLVIENSSPNKLKIYVKAENVKDSTVMLSPSDGGAKIVAESVPMDKILWVICLFTMFCVVFKVSKDITEDDDKILIKKDIKDREIKLYRQYRSQMATNQSLGGKGSIKMRNMIKKIDRKIDERLTSVTK